MKNNKTRKEKWLEKGYTEEQIECHLSFERSKSKESRKKHKRNNEKNKEIITKIKEEIVNQILECMSHNNTFGMIPVGDTFIGMMPAGAKIKFQKEKRRYTVQASNRFYSVCTKPQNLVTRRGKSGTVEKTVLYTIIDWYNQLRGTENLVIGMGAETREDCEEMLERLTTAESDVSSRNWCPLDVEAFELPKKPRPTNHP